ncbi:MAG: LPS-assembly protein LptD [Verrucomicrobia bacterium]|nr:LPS-assembly protein LptD [Verrucomicrobiota bacterium]
MIRRLVIILALGAAQFAPAQPQAAPPGMLSVIGDDVSLDLNTTESVFRGHAQIRDQGMLVLADEIRFNATTKVAIATGHIVFTRGGARLIADRLVYSGRDGSFSADNIRLGAHPVFIEGASASGSPTEITIEHASAAYGEPGPWQPAFRADRITYGPAQRLHSEKARLGIGHMKLLSFPRLQQDLALPFIFQVALNVGYRASLGAFAEADVHLPVFPALRLGGDLGIYTNRGLMAGPSGRYAAPQNPENLHGYFRSGYINDHGDKKTDILGRRVPEDRAYAEWRHTQRLAENLTLAAHVNWWRDSEVLRDFRPRAFLPVQAPDTLVESVYQGRNYFVSAFARFQPNTFHAVQQRLPEVRFDLLPLALGNGFYQRFNASAAVLREDPPEGGPQRRSDRLDAYYGLMRPFAPREWAAVTPIAGGRFTHYANTNGAVRDGSYSRLLGEIGLDAEVRAHGTFAYRNEQWKIDGLRHLLTPRLTYRHRPEAEKGRARIPRIDREVFSTYLPPLGLGDVRNLDDLHATNTLRFALDNTLQTRDPVHGSRDLVVFNVANDFRFRRQPGERDVSALHTELALMPARWLQLDIYQSLTPQTLALREFNSGITLRDGNAWSLRFANNYLRHEIKDYFVDGRFRINEVFGTLTRLHYDERRHRFTEQAYGVVQNLGNTWLISYTVSLHSGRRRESGFGLNVQIDTVRF